MAGGGSGDKKWKWEEGSSGLDVKKIKITINKKSITFLLNGHTSNFPLK